MTMPLHLNDTPPPQVVPPKVPLRLNLRRAPKVPLRLNLNGPPTGAPPPQPQWCPKGAPLPLFNLKVVFVVACWI